MTKVRTIIGGLLACGLCAVSVAANYRFGTHLAPGAEGYVYGALGGFADGLKTVLPLAIGAAWVARQYGRALAGLALFLVFSAYSLTSAFGLYSLSKADAVGDANAGKTAYTIAIEDRNAKRKRLAALGNARTVGAVQGDIAAAKQNRRWQSSDQCKNATVSASRAFCDNYAKLHGELSTAKEAQLLRAQLAEISAKLDGMNLHKVMRSADPQSEALAKLTGLDAEAIRSILAALVAVLIELGSGLGLWVATGGKSSQRTVKATPQSASPLPAREPLPKAEKGIDPVSLFAQENLSKRSGSEIIAGDLLSAFQHWASAHGYDTLNPTAFGRAMSDLGYGKERRGGKVRYQNLALNGLMSKSPAPGAATMH